MTWRIEGELIMDGERLVGSVVPDSQDEDGYLVEIMWSVGLGDLRFAGSLAECKAFICGVEMTMDRCSPPPLRLGDILGPIERVDSTSRDRPAPRLGDGDL